MITENFNIHDIIQFKIITSIPNVYPFNRNLEYEFFSTKEIIEEPDFEIINFFNSSKMVNYKKYCEQKYLLASENNIKYNYNLAINDLYKKGTKLAFNINYKNFRRVAGCYFAKNLFVRSLITLKLIEKHATLIHGAALLIDNKGVVLAGRPGVFKTSLVMDAIRVYEAKFLGDENIILMDDMIYSFPLNICSFMYKVKNFKNENASNKMEKMRLWNYLFWNKNYEISKIAEKSNLDVVLFLKKSNKLSINKISHEKMIDNLIYNELCELNIPPTHSLSGIKQNKFYDYLKKYDMYHLNSFNENYLKKFKKFVSNSIKNKPVYEIEIPSEYSKDILNKIVSEIL